MLALRAGMDELTATASQTLFFLITIDPLRSRARSSDLQGVLGIQCYDSVSLLFQSRQNISTAAKRVVKGAQDPEIYLYIRSIIIHPYIHTYIHLQNYLYAAVSYTTSVFPNTAGCIRLVLFYI